MGYVARSGPALRGLVVGRELSRLLQSCATWLKLCRFILSLITDMMILSGVVAGVRRATGIRRASTAT